MFFVHMCGFACTIYFVLVQLFFYAILIPFYFPLFSLHQFQFQLFANSCKDKGNRTNFLHSMNNLLRSCSQNVGLSLCWVRINCNEIQFELSATFWQQSFILSNQTSWTEKVKRSSLFINAKNTLTFLRDLHSRCLNSTCFILLHNF